MPTLAETYLGNIPNWRTPIGVESVDARVFGRHIQHAFGVKLAHPFLDSFGWDALFEDKERAVLNCF